MFCSNVQNVMVAGFAGLAPKLLCLVDSFIIFHIFPLSDSVGPLWLKLLKCFMSQRNTVVIFVSQIWFDFCSSCFIFFVWSSAWNTFQTTAVVWGSNNIHEHASLMPVYLRSDETWDVRGFNLPLNYKSFFHKTHPQYFLYQKSSCFLCFFFSSSVSLMSLLSGLQTIKHQDLETVCSFLFYLLLETCFKWRLPKTFKIKTK